MTDRKYQKAKKTISTSMGLKREFDAKSTATESGTVYKSRWDTFTSTATSDWGTFVTGGSTWGGGSGGTAWGAATTSSSPTITTGGTTGTWSTFGAWTPVETYLDPWEEEMIREAILDQLIG